MGLQIEIRLDLRHIVQENFIHGGQPTGKMLRPFNEPDLGKLLMHLLLNYRAVGVDDDLVDQRALQKAGQNVLVKRYPVEKPVVFSRHAFTGVAHGKQAYNSQ